MKTGTIDKLASEWVKEHGEYRDRPSAGVGSAYRELNRLIETDPEQCLNVIKRIIEVDNSDQVMEILAAGPLENLLVKNGMKIVDELVEHAASNEIFRKLLGGVWKSTIEDKVWRKVESIRQGKW